MRRSIIPPTIFLNRNIFLLLFSFFLFFGKSIAQSNDFISYGVEDGISQSEVQSVFQDSRGYLWVGTTGGGVCSFDGISFVEYGKKNGLAGQVVSCIAEDSIGNMWFGTQGGLNIYDGKTFSTFGKEQLGFSEILSLIPQKNSLWVAGQNGISEYNYASHAIRKIISEKIIHTLCKDEQGIIWAGGGSTLLRFKGYAYDTVDLKLPRGYKGSIFSVCSDKKGLLYIGLSDRLIIYRPATGTFTENLFTELFKDKTVHAVYVDHLGAVWVATLNNLVANYAVDGKIKLFNSENGLSAEGVFQMTEDNTHHMWFATREQSLLKLRSNTFTYFGNQPGMGSGTVFRLTEDHLGNIWIGSNQDGLYCFDGKKSFPILTNGKPFKQPVAVIEDKNNCIWVGHFDGVSCIQNGHVIKTILAGQRIRALMQDSKGNIWIGTWGKGAFVFDGKNLVEHNQEKKELPGNFVHAFLEDKKGIIWIGTGSGLCMYDPKISNGNAFKSFGTADGLFNAYVGSIVEDPYGKIWFYTDVCVMRFDGKQFLSYTDDNGLASNNYYLVAFDNDSNLWVGSNKGIDRVRIDDAGRFLSVKNFSRNEGFRGIECNSRAVCKTRDGCLWFGTVKGVIRYNPNIEEEEGDNPIIHLSSIRLFLEKTDWSWTGIPETGFFHIPEKLTLESDQNHLTFLYQAINLQNPQSVRYQFMLCGFDSTWQPSTTSSQFSYTNLPPGNYVFKVRASSLPNKWSEVVATSGLISILPPPPPFWKTWWFVTFSILAFGAILFYVVIGRTRRILKQKLLLEAEVRERTLEISRQNQEKTVMLKEIHHRVKNNLQVISSLLNLQADGITDKRVLSLFEDCRNRVNSMALIHEKMYQSNNLVNIDISNYIDELIRSLIDTYDSNKSIRLHTDIENHPLRIDTIVPLGLILNEIISNALKYAFEEKKEGDLTVTLHKISENHFVLEVSDNGKGIPSSINFDHAETLGMQLIQMLSGQINGTVSMLNENGTKYRIEFKEEVKDRF